MKNRFISPKLFFVFLPLTLLIMLVSGIFVFDISA